MYIRRILCAVLVVLLLLSCTVAAQANTTTSLPLLLPAEEPVKLDNIRQTMDALLHQADDADVAAAYSAALLEQYFGVRVRCSDQTSLWSDPVGGTVLSSAPDGEVLRLLGVADGRYKVFYEDQVSYLPANFATLLVYDAYQETLVDPVNTVCQDLVAEALSWLGTPYYFGGSSKSGTDCSGFTMAVFALFGYTLPHGAGDQYAVSTPVTDQERDVGDLVFFSWGSGIAHVGIYLGGGTFIHASTSHGVIISSLYESYYANGYVGAGRILTA